MAGSVNRVILVGNVGKDPEIRATQSGKEIASFSMAMTESWKDASGERKEKTEWVNIVIFNPGLVGVVKNYVKKGSKLYIEGSLQTRKWQDQSGNDKYTTEVVLQAFGGTLVLLDKFESNGGSGGQTQRQESPKRAQASEFDDDIPFTVLLPLIGAAASALNFLPFIV